MWCACGLACSLARGLACSLARGNTVSQIIWIGHGRVHEELVMYTGTAIHK